MSSRLAFPEIDEARDFLRGHLGRDVPDLAFVGEGAWSRCFGFRDAARDLVVRFGGYREDFEKDRRAGALRSETLPIPEVLEIGEAPGGGYFAISSRAHGEALESLDVDGWRAVLPSFFAALDAARSVDLAETPGYGMWDSQGRARFGSWREFLMAVDADTPDLRTHGWRKKLGASATGDALFRAGHALLGELAEAGPTPRSLVHSDLINRNVLVAGDRIGAIFDWGCSLYGDFLYDIAWLDFWSPWHPGLAQLGIVDEARRHFAASGQDVPDFETRIRCCKLHIGLDNISYNAHTGSTRDLEATAERMAPLFDG